MAAPKTPKSTKVVKEISRDEIEDILGKLDQAKIQDLRQKIADKKEQIARKEYAVGINSSNFQNLYSFMCTDAEWTQTECIGVIEVIKVLDAVKKEGIKDNTVFMGALPLEAIHYFLSKKKGKGLEEAIEFLDMWKPIDQALQSAKNDAVEIKDLEKQLSAAEQGIELV
jgi:hypothetical protein